MIGFGFWIAQNPTWGGGTHFFFYRGVSPRVPKQRATESAKRTKNSQLLYRETSNRGLRNGYKPLDLSKLGKLCTMRMENRRQMALKKWVITAANIQITNTVEPRYNEDLGIMF